MLTLPIYFRNSTYYLHTRILGKQFKRSLNTANKSEAIIRALELLKLVQMSRKLTDFNLDLTNLRKYELDLSKGIAKSDSPEDHLRMVETLKLMQSLQTPSQNPVQAPTTSFKGVAEGQGHPDPGLTLLELLDKFLLFRPVKPATTIAYKLAIEEFSGFIGNKKKLHTVLTYDITKFQEYLILKGNVHRTIDNKIGIIKTLFFFAIKQHYYFGENPASKMNLLSKREKMTGGYSIFEEDEIKKIFHSDFMNTAKKEDLDYYWVLVLGLVTGCRISEITSLTAEQFKVTKSGLHYFKLNDAKTLAGKREIPFPVELMAMGLQSFIPESGQLFKYQLRLGKGSGNAVGKKFSRHLKDVGITAEKLVFHSLRKFVNDYFMKSSIQIEPRCQFFGHSLDNVNVQTYAKKFTVDDIAKSVLPVQKEILLDFVENPQPLPS